MVKRELEFLPIKTFRFDSAAEAASSVAREMSNWIRTKKYHRGDACLAFSSGEHVRPTFDKMREMSGIEEKGGLAVSTVRCFGLAEFEGRGPGDAGSTSAWMDEAFYSKWGASAEFRHELDGRLEGAELEAHCAAYEAALAKEGPADVLMIGLGATGRLGLHEPGCDPNARTGLVTLSDRTREELAQWHGGIEVPERAVSAGVATYRSALRVRVFAFGEHMAEVVDRGMLPDPDPQNPLSLLVGHKDVELLLDPAAAAMLE
ncbi:Glucosamine-6-phosphate deaminase 1 [Planctomycetes bacterium Pla163]|uniref:Glucosamine-6-phosphate deaminase 1 n=1 Tax=Rohdeia mirabilis TaxID=2528008 RepID=A0A518D3K9_9BACT|nr:Glucosamine-6-phosphate deaminase 1 [Planctomycetes bacterium Pla163]